MKRLDRGCLPKTPMPLEIYTKLLAIGYKPVTKNGVVFIVQTPDPFIRLYEVVAENKEDEKKLIAYKKGDNSIKFNCLELKDLEEVPRYK